MFRETLTQMEVEQIRAMAQSGIHSIKHIADTFKIEAGHVRYIASRYASKSNDVALQSSSDRVIRA